MSPKAPDVVLRAVGGALFIIGGCSLTLMGMIGAAPSLWYFLCYCALPIIGIVWLWKPPLAAALSIGPLISVAALLSYASGMWRFSQSWAVAVIAGLTAAIVLVVAALRGSPKWRLPVVVSLAFVACAFATDRLFTNKVAIRTYQMHVAINGHAPWGDVGPEWSDGSPPIVLYRRLGDGYCYDGFRSEELRRRLVSKDGQTVKVQYNVFSDFGKDRSYNVRSVDGLLFNDGLHAVRDYQGFGGQILGNTGTSARGADCR